MKTETWGSVPLAPADSIFKLTAAYKEDKDERKVNLGAGTYRDDENKPWILPVVKKATRILLNDSSVDHEYLPILGLPEFTKAAAKLMFGGSSKGLREDRIVSAQTISGTGAVHLAGLFLARFYEWNGPAQIYMSDPSYGELLLLFFLMMN